MVIMPGVRAWRESFLMAEAVQAVPCLLANAKDVIARSARRYLSAIEA